MVSGINATRKNPHYLPDIELPPAVTAFADLGTAVTDADLVVFAVPSHVFRSVAEQVKPWLNPSQYLVSLTKGIENETFYTMSQVLAEVTADAVPDEHIGVLSGPSHAEEVARDMPTTAVAAAYSKRAALIIQDVFHSPSLRIYVNQ
ncbi:hypothetical protein RZS08_09920, partial [Arthrospira platensis SPKY1]|nr:hypothetical protein [Arthrospira platensis SPKY1]